MSSNETIFNNDITNTFARIEHDSFGFTVFCGRILPHGVEHISATHVFDNETEALCCAINNTL